MNRFTPLWLAWGVMFLVIEGVAMRNRDRIPDATLSSLVWRFIEGHPIQRVLFGIGWAALTVHFFFHLF